MVKIHLEEVEVLCAPCKWPVRVDGYCLCCHFVSFVVRHERGTGLPSKVAWGVNCSVYDLVVFRYFSAPMSSISNAMPSCSKSTFSEGGIARLNSNFYVDTVVGYGGSESKSEAERLCMECWRLVSL